jgi:hypothetical protein
MPVAPPAAVEVAPAAPTAPVIPSRPVGPCDEESAVKERRARYTWLVAIALSLAPALTFAQGLGDVASREKSKRQQPKKAEPARVFTNDDLPAGGTSGAGDAAPAADGAAGDTGTAPASPEGAAATTDPTATKPVDPLDAEREERRRLEADWRVRFANARERLANAEAASWQDVVRTEFYQGVPVQMKVKEQVETPELVASRKALADLEEEFRRTGLPPGWAR